MAMQRSSRHGGPCQLCRARPRYTYSSTIIWFNLHRPILKCDGHISKGSGTVFVKLLVLL